MNIAVFCDDYYHPGKIVQEGLDTLGMPEIQFEYVTDPRGWTAEKLQRFGVIVMACDLDHIGAGKTEWMTPEMELAFERFVSSGKGIFAIHAGTAGYLEKEILKGLYGGVFVDHPPQCQVTAEPKDGHQMTGGCAPFTLIDEHYFLDFNATDADIFLTTSSEHGRQPAGWTRRQGDGRVCVLTPGHNLEVWLHTSFQALLRNGLLWCGGIATE